VDNICHVSLPTETVRQPSRPAVHDYQLELSHPDSIWYTHTQFFLKVIQPHDGYLTISNALTMLQCEVKQILDFVSVARPILCLFVFFCLCFIVFLCVLCVQFLQ